MGIYTTKSKWQKALRPIVDFCIDRRIHPDVFTYGALALSGIAGIAFLMAEGNYLWLWVVPPCVLLRLLLNLMDGQIARACGLADAWGEVKNEFGDRVADAAIFLGLEFGGYADAALVALALALILMSSYLGIFGKALGGQRVYGGLFGKGDRMISLALFTLYPALSGNLMSFNLYLGLAALAASVTILQRLRTIYEFNQSTH
jgi:CDP-diacylglycerol---glycerol-3-phosphate 3-phosphatidyltransferase